MKRRVPSIQKLTSLGPVVSLLFASGVMAQPPQPQVAGSSVVASDSKSSQNPAEQGDAAKQDDAGEGDAIDSLLRRGMFERAEAVASQRLDAVALSSAEAAKWAVALSSARLAKLLQRPLADQRTLLDAAIEPLDRIRLAYPDHRRLPWLRFQQIVVEVAVARRQALVVVATPGDEARRLAVLATLIQASGTLQELEQELAEEIASSFARRDPPAWIDELMALRNAIAVKRVDVLLRRGELFAADSDDFLAAAGQAQQAAADALALVREDPPRRAELVRMRCEALLRMGQPDRAAELLGPLMSNDSDSDAPLDDATLALAVRVALERGRMQQAEQLLAAHYGDQPAEAPAAPETDLARLRVLIARDAPEGEDAKLREREIGDWIEAVRQRGGDFAHRRAETIALELLAERSDTVTDDRIVMAEAAARLRQGEPAAAAEMLDQAARRATHAATAHRLAIAGAAAYGQAKQELQSVKLLREIAEAHGANPASADLYLQAAVLLDHAGRAAAIAPSQSGESSQSSESGESSEAGHASQVDQLLRQLLQRWPGERAALQARGWLVARLLAAGKPVEAAIAASPTEKEAATDRQWEEATALWVDALSAVPLLTPEFSPNPKSLQWTSRALAHLPASGSPAARRCRGQVIALFAIASELSQVEPATDDEPLIRWLLAVRRGRPVGPPPAAAVASPLRPAAVQRLVADGIDAPRRRSELAEAILQLVAEEPGLPRAQALIWIGDWQTADEVLSQWAAGPEQRQGPEQGHATSIMAATLLARAQQPAAKRKALQRYAAVGAQLIQGSGPWHQVKLAMIQLMNELDQPEEASRLAKYILLTQPPQDAETQQGYRRWAEP